jgi:hypothetical protein
MIIPTEQPENNIEEAKEATEEASAEVAASAEVTPSAEAEADTEARAEEAAGDVQAARIAAIASANAAALLCDLILSGCAGGGCNIR